MRFTLAAISLAGAASLVHASTHQASPRAHYDLARRTVDVSVHKNDPRTLCLIEGLLGLGGSGCGSSKPSSTWTCSGSGRDGYDYDPSGKTCPSSYPVCPVALLRRHLADLTSRSVLDRVAGSTSASATAGIRLQGGRSLPSRGSYLRFGSPSCRFALGGVRRLSVVPITWLTSLVSTAPPQQWTCPPSVQPPQWWPQPPAPSTTHDAPAPTPTEDPYPDPEPTPDTPDCPPANWQCDGSGNDGWE